MPVDGVKGIHTIRDYDRMLYSDIFQRGQLQPHRELQNHNEDYLFFIMVITFVPSKSQDLQLTYQLFA
jgi:hypothetical protein